MGLGVTFDELALVLGDRPLDGQAAESKIWSPTVRSGHKECRASPGRSGSGQPRRRQLLVGVPTSCDQFLYLVKNPKTALAIDVRSSR